MSENRVIGSGAGMPWSVPDEYQQYLNFVTSQTVIMGRKSYEIFGADLPATTTAIVVSRNASIAGVTVVHSFENAIAAAGSTGKATFVAGGGMIYAEAVPIADEMYLSTIKGQFEGDTYFPEFDVAEWEVTEEHDAAEFIFRKYQRIN